MSVDRLGGCKLRTMPHTKGIKATEKDKKIGSKRKLRSLPLDDGGQEVLEVPRISP